MPVHQRQAPPSTRSPSPWRRDFRLGNHVRRRIALEVPGSSWWRTADRLAHGTSTPVIEFAWIADGDLRFATFPDLTERGAGDGPPEILDRRRVPLSRIVRVTLTPRGDTVTTDDGEPHRDWPSALIYEHFDGGGPVGQARH